MSQRKIGKSWWIDFQYRGRRVRRRSPINNKEGAKNYETVLRERVLKGEPLDRKTNKDKEQLFRDYLTKWYKGYVLIYNKHSEQLSKKYIIKNHLLPYFGKTPLDKITHLQIEKFKKLKLESNCKKKTIDNYLAVLSKSLSTAKDWYNLDPIPKVNLFNEKAKEMKCLSIKDAKRLLEASNGLWHEMILIALHTGMRLGELIALSWEDIDFDNKILTVNHSIVRSIKGLPKSNKTRKIPLTKDVIETLYKRKKKSGYVFMYNGTFLKTHNCSNSLNRIIKKADLPEKFGWHRLRHSFASHLVQRNANIKTVQELMGHSDIQTTMKYIHINSTHLQEAIKLLENKDNKDKCQHSVNLPYYQNMKTEKIKIIFPNIKEKQGC